MTHPIQREHARLCLPTLVLLAMTCHAHAASLTGEGSTAGAQCFATGVNNSGTVVGSCSPASVGGALRAWVAPAVGAETTLQPLMSGQSCAATGIANNGAIIGTCRNGSNVRHAVTWQASAPMSAPLRLLPLPGLLGLLADIRTSATAYNQLGAVAGSSFNSTGDTTAVMWAAGDDTAVQVSSRGDNCNAVDLSEYTTAGRPAVALNCPNASGTLTGKVAQATGLLNAYVVTNLPMPAGGTYCTVSSINSSLQALGTCHFAAPDVPRVAFWSSPSATPTTLVNSARSRAVALNNLGHAVLTFQDAEGNRESAFWDPGTGSFTVIPPLPGGARSEVMDLADNDFAILNSENEDQNVEGAFWRSSTGTTSVGFFEDGEESMLHVVSTNGLFAAGEALDEDDDRNAVVTALP